MATNHIELSWYELSNAPHVQKVSPNTLYQNPLLEYISPAAIALVALAIPGTLCLPQIPCVVMLA